MRKLLLAAILAVAASVQPPPRSYVFSYFTNNGEDGLHLLSSTDGLQWTPLNGGRSFLYPAVGSRLMRDPSITRGPDGMFHLVWTTGWWDTGIMCGLIQFPRCRDIPRARRRGARDRSMCRSPAAASC